MPPGLGARVYGCSAGKRGTQNAGCHPVLWPPPCWRPGIAGGWGGFSATAHYSTVDSQAQSQQRVANFNVWSNASGMVTGTALGGGNIEFWPQDYGQGNAVAVQANRAQTPGEVPRALSRRIRRQRSGPVGPFVLVPHSGCLPAHGRAST